MGQALSARDSDVNSTSSWLHYKQYLIEAHAVRHGELLVQYLDGGGSVAATLLSSSVVTPAFDSIDRPVVVTSLSLRCNWISSLDEALLKPLKQENLNHMLMSLTSLDARANTLRGDGHGAALTALASSSPKLTKLLLSRNSFTVVPIEISFLKNITTLDLSHNSLLGELPSCIYELRQLTYLDLSNNSLARCSEGIGALSSLQVLLISHNNLWEHAIPESIADLTSLDRLEVQHNPVLECPTVLGALTSLRILSLSQTKCKLSDLDKHLSKLVILESLSLAHLGLTKVPESFAFLTRLEKLDLAFNKIDSVPHSLFAPLSRLRKVNLLMNALDRLPSSLLELPAIEVVALRGNPIQILSESSSAATPSLSQLPPNRMLGSAAVLRHSASLNTIATLELEETAFINLSPVTKIERDQISLALNRPKPRNVAIFEPSYTTLSRSSLVDRILGLIFGAALGDAAGLSTEFMTRETALFHYESHKSFELGVDYVQDRHRAAWMPGDWTDDTDQMILILDALAHNQGRMEDKASYFAHALHNWMYHGVKEHGDHAGSGLGANTYAVLSHPQFLVDPLRASKEVWERSGRVSAANGAVMRTSVVGVPFFWDLSVVCDNARLLTRVTHYDPKCAASSIFVSVAVALMLQCKSEHTTWTKEGMDALFDAATRFATAELSSPDSSGLVDVSELLRHTQVKHLHELALDDGKRIGYTYKALGAGCWALKHEGTFESAITALTFEGGDSDTNGAVAGALLGCKVGYSQLPIHWLDRMPHHAWLLAKAYSLLDTLGI